MLFWVRPLLDGGDPPSLEALAAAELQTQPGRLNRPRPLLHQVTDLQLRQVMGPHLRLHPHHQIRQAEPAEYHHHHLLLLLHREAAMEEEQLARSRLRRLLPLQREHHDRPPIQEETPLLRHRLWFLLRFLKLC